MPGMNLYRADSHCFYERQVLVGGMGRFAQSNADRDQRRHNRRHLPMSAWIDRGPKLTPIACTFDDVSEGGARVHVSSKDMLPARFILLLSQTASAGVLCEVRWRRGEMVGVKYLTPARPRSF
jgi:hypothetical protein